jgi:GNAT superfamily N-acetyltransferase
MDVTIRSAIDPDANACGRICYEGFRAINERRGFPPIFASVEVATRRVAAFISHPSVFSVVAETNDGDRRIVGFNFLSEHDPIRAIGPIVIDPAIQGHGIGRRLMQAALDRARGARGVRLMQESYNLQSFSLYAGLGFDAQEFFVVLSGTPAAEMVQPGYEIRPLTKGDIGACESLHASVLSYSRTNELLDALATGEPIAALRDGHLSAYMTMPTNWLANHGVAATDEDLHALILGAAQARHEPLSFLLPARASLLRWCLNHGFRALRPMTLMTIGEYREPDGSYIPSVLY